MKFVILFTLGIVAACASRPTLEQLEDEANTTGDWTAVERREEVIKKRLESTAPGCAGPFRKKCFEQQTGIECYCLPTGKRR
ncbi:MAG: hypothetical protein OEV34_12145 [Gammaproteobacteria bacterium]|jgi:hypothetical protein|nr:hypothetical protein [Gammaproteobacteria bacterium]